MRCQIEADGVGLPDFGLDRLRDRARRVAVHINAASAGRRHLPDGADQVDAALSHVPIAEAGTNAVGRKVTWERSEQELIVLHEIEGRLRSGFLGDGDVANAGTIGSARNEAAEAQQRRGVRRDEVERLRFPFHIPGVMPSTALD